MPSQDQFNIGRRSVLGLAAAGVLPALTAHLKVPATISPPIASTAVSSEIAVSASYATQLASTLLPVKLTATSKVASEIMVAIDKTRSRGWNCYSAHLKETRDDGVTWRIVRTFTGELIEAVLPLDNGELLVFVQVPATAMRKVYRSYGYGSASATWSVVLNGSNPQVKFASSWGLSVHGNIVLANEYGPKSGYPWSGGTQIIAEGKNARYTYLSLDYGRTWARVFDLNAWITAKGRSTKGQHLHGVAWDPHWSRIWVTFGDNMSGAASNGILYSDNLGSTWKEAHFFSGVNGTQSVGIVPMPRCILLAGDVNPSGLLRINRAEGKWRTGHYTLDVAYDAPAGMGTMHLGQGNCRIRSSEDDARAFFGFCPDIVEGRSFVIATDDGYSVSKIWNDASTLPSGKGIRNVLGPTLRGNLIVASNDGRVAGRWSEFKGRASDS